MIRERLLTGFNCMALFLKLSTRCRVVFCSCGFYCIAMYIFCMSSIYYITFQITHITFMIKLFF